MLPSTVDRLRWRARPVGRLHQQPICPQMLFLSLGGGRRMAGARDKLDFLQVFRAIAASIVALAHIAKEVTRHAAWSNSAILPWFNSMIFGVDIFFVISGFIMVYTTRNAVGGLLDSRAFFLRRLVRIVPVYWLYTTLFVLILFVSPSNISHNTTSLGHVIASYLFIPVPLPGTDHVEPVFALGWTLNFEMFFYVVFSLLLFLPRQKLMPRLCGLFLVLVFVGIWIPQQLPALWYWTRSSILEFLFGAIIASLFLQRKEIPVWACFALVLVGGALWQVNFALFPNDAGVLTWRGILWGIPAALLVGGVALCPPARNFCASARWLRPVVVVGDSSYSLYLVHMFAVRIMTFLVPVGVLGGAYPVVFMATALLAAIVAAYLSYIWFERPVHEWGKQWTRRYCSKPV